MRCLAKTLIAILLTMALFVPAFADEEEKTPKPPVADWLVLGPVTVPYPAFSDEDDKKPKAADLLGYAHLNTSAMWPLNGQSAAAMNGSSKWSQHGTQDGVLTIEPAGDGPDIAYLAAYVEVPRWMKVEFEVDASHAFELFVGGKSVAKRDKAGDKSKSGTASLEQGKHAIVLKTVYVKDDEHAEWSVRVGVAAEKEGHPAPTLSTDARRFMNISDVLDARTVGGLNLSPDGKLLLMSVSSRKPPEGDRDSWMEIRDAKSGKLVQTLRDMSGSSWQWAPTGHRLSYVRRQNDKAFLRVLDVDSGETETILDGIKDFTNYQWSPDGTFIAYAINKEPEKSKTGVQRLRGVSDRRAGERNRSSVYISSVPGGMTRRITSGEHQVGIRSIHPDGTKILIERSYENIEERPFSMDELWLIHTNGSEPEMLVKDPWMGTAMWSPDGKKILVTSGPSSFDRIGANVPDGVIPNDYDAQAFLIDAESKAVDPITREFDPTIQSVFWPRPGSHIFFVVGEGEYNRLYRYDVGSRKFTKIDIDCDVIGSRTVADNAFVGAVTGAKANRPARLYAVDLRKGRASELMDPAKERFATVAIGDVETWEFKARNGRTITGRIHFPPNFDPDELWPCIVYYYGGTAPVTRGFGGRYPKNLWAAHGYVVYVLQPSGATGFGQEYSSLHVNEWGTIVADEIIEGVQKFASAHDYIDDSRIGCIGASFGGFMTELLVTRTDIFAAAVSHAGISMISSYWGEGDWGYGYNSQSAADSYPWNRKDIYVDQSPLFGVENVTTPILLTHGSADNNVPPGESEQFYTALKILGKEVEYLRVEGERHWVIDYKKRIVWSNAIVAWFDKWLKDEPDWWNDMYPPLEDDEDEEDEEN